MARVFGYVRVSTKEQNVSRQIEELKTYVPSKDNMIIDHASGKDFDRPNYKALRQLSTEGDTIYIKSLDRLGRNKTAIKEELEYFKNKGVFVRVLDVPTTLIDLHQYGDFSNAIMDMINNVLIEVLGTIAEQERKNIKQRQKEGIEIAKKQGKYLGRKKIEYPTNWEQVYSQWEHDEITAKTAIELLGLKKTTFYKLVKEYREEAQG